MTIEKAIQWKKKISEKELQEMVEKRLLQNKKVLIEMGIEKIISDDESRDIIRSKFLKYDYEVK